MKKLLVILLLLPCFSFGQINLDSLWAVWNDKTKPDTSRCKAMKDISWYGYLFTQPDSAFYYAQLQYEYAKSKGLKKQMAAALNTQGASFYIRGEYDSAIDHYTRSLTIYEELGNSPDKATAKAGKQGIAASLNNIGIIYVEQGDFASAIDYYTRSLTIKEEMGNATGIAASLNNIGLIYDNQGDYASAIDHYTRSLTISEEIGDKQGIAMSLNNIGNIYYKQGDSAYTAGNTALSADRYASAIDHYTRSLTIHEEIGDKKGIASSLNNIGSIYYNKGDYANAIDHYTRSLTIHEEMGNKQGIATSLNSIGIMYRQQGDYASAIASSARALTVAQEVGAAKETRDAANALYEAYKASGRHKSALEMYELYIATRDSLESEENQKAVIRQQFKYDYEKQALADSLEFAKEQEVKDLEISEQQAQLKQEATVRYALMGGGALFLILALVAFRSYRLKRKDNLLIAEQKEEVEQQKELVDEKNKEITDSITYAKRIQEAILPPDKLVKEYLEESFILYKPKDIVAGDFYWMENVSPLLGGDLGVGETPLLNPAQGGNTILFAAADCTGHGVPGAMVSVVCHNALNRAVREFKLTDPGKILDKVRELVIETFRAGGQAGEKSDHEVKDGMDISLCSLELPPPPSGTPPKSRGRVLLEYAGANNPLWVFRKGISDIEQIEDIKGDKQPIGKYAAEKPFTTHTIELQQGDSIYIFSDGFADQFGGEKGKKFKYRQFRELLLANHHKPIEEQKQILDETIENWKGNLEQVDDICIIGVRV